jgi:hypothetical protein
VQAHARERGTEREREREQDLAAADESEAFGRLHEHIDGDGGASLLALRGGSQGLVHKLCVAVARALVHAR